MDITPEQRQVLQAQTPETLAKWWCLLNGWEWPAELPGDETLEEYKAHMLKFGGAGVASSRRGHVMSWIEGVVSRRAISREWNRDMTDEEFEDFWRGNHEGDPEAKARYWARLEAASALRAKWPTTLYEDDEWPDELDAADDPLRPPTPGHE